MRLNVKSTLIITLLYIASIQNGHAFNIDETVDDEIRKNYNPSQLIIDVSPKSSNFEKKIEQPTEIIDENLPALPNISKTKYFFFSCLDYSRTLFLSTGSISVF